MSLPFGKEKSQPLVAGRNDAVRRALRDRGDDGSTVRHVIHFAYPAKGMTDLSSRPQTIDELRAQGYEVKDAAAESGLVFEHYRSVAPRDFDDMTEALEDWFKDRGWSYDGWECAVVRSLN